MNIRFWCNFSYLRARITLVFVRFCLAVFVFLGGLPFVSLADEGETGSVHGGDLTLSEALDQPDWLFTTGGDSPWFPQEEETYDGRHAAQSGPLTHSQSSWLETVIEGAGYLTFWWKVSSEVHFDFLSFYVDGERIDRISGERGWHQRGHEFGSGEHRLRWEYSKDFSVSHGEDAGWLDQLAFQPSDALEVAPGEGWFVSGFAGVPITATQDYVLQNTGEESLSWSSSASVDWLEISQSGGIISPGETATVTVSFSENAADQPEGTYEGEVRFTNDTTGIVRDRRVFLDLMPAPGELAIRDSVAPGDDRLMPFGELSLGLSRTETVTIQNVDNANDLLIERIFLRPVISDGSGEGGESVAGYTESSESVSVTSVDGSGEDRGVPENRSGPGTPSGRSPGVDLSQPHDPEHILVRFKDEADTFAMQSAHVDGGGRVLREMRRVPLQIIEKPGGEELEAVLEVYNKHPAVAYAEPNYIVTIDSVPDDPRFDELWGLHNTGQTGGVPGADINVLDAWGITRGSREIVVAVIDTGIDYTHPDLEENIWVNPNPTFGDIHGASWLNRDGTVTSGDPMDDHGHGTHVAGTIGAVGNNGIGVTGVNWEVRLMALKFLDSTGNGTTADAVAALEYAIEHGAHLSNNSWGGGGHSQALRDAIAAARVNNQLFITSAGNSDSDNDMTPTYPASYDLDNIISVASSNDHDGRALLSNYGATSVHLAAPGSRILSTVLDGRYDTFSGTSMAAPHVTGVAALILGLAPGLEYDSIRQAIFDGVVPLPQWEGVVITGGRLDAALALENIVADFDLRRVPELPVTLSPGRSIVLEVAYEPTGIGTHNAEIFIKSDDPEEGEAVVSLTGEGVLDDFVIGGDEALLSTGFAGGPFEPSQASFSLRNDGGDPLEWSAAATVEWLELEDTEGTLAPGENVALTAALTESAADLEPGVYSGSIHFLNHDTGLVQERPLRLDVLALPGTLVIRDSVAPDDDRLLPFGELYPGESARESVTLTNTHSQHDLVLEEVSLMGGYREDFRESNLWGWRPKPFDRWSLDRLSYFAVGGEQNVFMQSIYDEEAWFNATVEVGLRREGNQSYATALILRASDDFDLERGAGSAIVVGLSWDGYFYVARFLDSEFQWVHPWAFSDSIDTDGPNLLLVSFRNNTLHVVVNEELVWSGQVGGLYRAGRIGLAGYSTGEDPTSHRFHFVEVREALAEVMPPLTAKQSWFNSQSVTNEGNYAYYVPESPVKAFSEGQKADEEAIDYSEAIRPEETFTTPDPGDLPAVIGPGEEHTLPVWFRPSGEGIFSRTLRLVTNDPEEPNAEVSLSGTSRRDALRFQPMAAFTARGERGGPFSPASGTYVVHNTGADPVDWEVRDIPDWLEIEPETGTLDPDELAELTVSVSSSANALPPGELAGIVRILNKDTNFYREIDVRLEVQIPFCEAVSACALVWESGGNVPWFGQDEVLRNGEPTAMSGRIGDDEESWVETVVTGPGKLGFWWMVSSEASYDFLEFYINGELEAAISGDVFWEKREFVFPEGEHTLRWRYVKDFVWAEGADAGWLDDVTFTEAAATRVLEVTESLNFGIVYSEEPVTRTAIVRNNGSASLTIDAISLPPEVSVDWESATLAPGAEKELAVTVTPSEPGVLEGELVFVSNATAGDASIFLWGNVSERGIPVLLEAGERIEGLAGGAGEGYLFAVDLSDGRDFLEMEIEGGSGDADLYVRHGAPATTEEWDFAPLLVGNEERVRIEDPEGGRWYGLVHGHKDFERVVLSVRYAPAADGSLSDWAASIGLPPDGRSPHDRHGPLGMPNLLAYGMGLDPRVARPDELPRLARSGDEELLQLSLFYSANPRASESRLSFESSTDMQAWDEVEPVVERVVTEEGGVEKREAVFGVEGDERFYLRLRVILEDIVNEE